MNCSYLVIVLVLPFCYASNAMKFGLQTHIIGNQCASNAIAFQVLFESLFGCTSMCVSTADCLRVFYDKSTNFCMGCSSFVNEASSIPTTQLYVKQPMAYLGCFWDSVTDLTMTGHSQDYGLMNANEFCSQTCHDLGFTFSGTSATIWCLCDNNIDITRIVPESDCNQLCPADNMQFCGSNWRISVSIRL